MKLAIFNLREDEKNALEKWRKNNSEIEIIITEDPLTLENIELLSGVDGAVFAQNKTLEDDIYSFAKEQGVKVFATRSAGYDIYNLNLLKEYGIKLTNVPSYSPNAIAEHVVGMTLYLSRNYKKIMNRVEKNNFSWRPEILSRELRTMTVGIIGTGRIGIQAARLFKGLGATVLGYDVYPNKENEEILTYVSLDELARKSDVVSLHIPATAEYKYLINDDFLAKMPENSILINAARGILVDTEAVLRALDSGKLLGAGLDVYENEHNFVPRDLSSSKLNDDLLKSLISRDDIIYTPHTAFYTTSAIENLVSGALDAAVEVISTGKSANEVKY